VDVPELHDDEIVLRAWSMADAEWYARCSQDPEIQRFTTDPADLTAADVAAAITALAPDPRHVGFLVADVSTGTRLGNLAVDHADRAGEVSYWVAAEARGRGVATRALRLLAGWAFGAFDIDVLRLCTHVDKTASRAAAEWVGFTRVPSEDRTRVVRGAVWPTVAYELSDRWAQ
jgi:RimJ/RimL family protein N-acetyltransferase